MKIVVLRKHIERGIRQHNCCCPIALAICDSLGRDDVRVTNTEVAVGDGRAMLPLNAKQFIEDFDAGMPRKALAPFEFDLSATPSTRSAKNG